MYTKSTMSFDKICMDNCTFYVVKVSNFLLEEIEENLVFVRQLNDEVTEHVRIPSNLRPSCPRAQTHKIRGSPLTSRSPLAHDARRCTHECAMFYHPTYYNLIKTVAKPSWWYAFHAKTTPVVTSGRILIRFLFRC